MGKISGFLGLVFSLSLGTQTGFAQEWFPVANEHSVESIIGSNNLEVIENAKDTELYTWARAVAKVTLGGGACTGFRLSETLFMTNNHCYNAASCSNTRFILGYERELPETERRTFKCKEVLSTSSGLDYALYRVEDISETSIIDDYPYVTLSAAPVIANMPLFIAGHPQARKKEMDRSDNCKLRTAPSSSGGITHVCDTEPGNSGSAVFDRATGHVIGIHWGGGSYNQANSMQKILPHIKSRVEEAVYQELTIVE